MVRATCHCRGALAGAAAVRVRTHPGCDISGGRLSRRFVLAETLVSALGDDAAVCDALRWNRPMSPAHVADGSRDPQTLYGLLRLRDRHWLLAGQRLMLVDDPALPPRAPQPVGAKPAFHGLPPPVLSAGRGRSTTTCPTRGSLCCASTRTDTSETQRCRAPAPTPRHALQSCDKRT